MTESATYEACRALASYSLATTAAALATSSGQVRDRSALAVARSTVAAFPAAALVAFRSPPYKVFIASRNGWIDGLTASR